MALARSSTPGRSDTHALIGMGDLAARLGSEARVEREGARRSLVAIGLPAVPALIVSLQRGDESVRWEAAKALTQVCDASAAPALVAALDDEEPGVRWLAAEALINLGRPALDPLLHALISEDASAWVREGAHHVLGRTREGDLWPVLSPVVAAIEGPAQAVATMHAASEALKALGPGGYGS